MQPPADDVLPLPSTEGADLLSYRFQDSSVPPPYHRSYTITATPDHILRVVDSYGEEIERQEASLDPGALHALLDVLGRSCPGRRATPLENRGCTGGTGESITVRRGEEVLFEASVYHCGGSDSGDLLGDAGVLRDAMLAHLSK